MTPRRSSCCARTGLTSLAVAQKVLAIWTFSENWRVTQEKVTPPAISGPAAFGPEWEKWLTYAWHRLQDHIDLQGIHAVCAANDTHLYGADAPKRTLRYVPKQRPVIESLLGNLIHAEPRLLSAEPQPIAMALLEWVHWEVLRRGEVLQRGCNPKQILGGGVEEETLAFIGRTGTFECARLLSTLLQAKGIPARLLFVFQPEFQARAGVEAHFDGEWHVLDIANCRQHVDARAINRAATPEFADSLMGACDYPARDEVKRW